MDLDGHRRQLLALRAETLAAGAELARSFRDIVAASDGANADDEHDPEGATIAYERSLVGALSARALDRLADIDAALARIADGTYGTCTRCGGRIGEPRLEARPDAARCVACASGNRPPGDEIRDET